MSCNQKNYDELDAKNEALRLTRKARFLKPKTGNTHGQSRAYFCHECTAWHVKTELPQQITLEPLCQELSSIRN
jgi:hypothetical protein